MPIWKLSDALGTTSMSNYWTYWTVTGASKQDNNFFWPDNSSVEYDNFGPNSASPDPNACVVLNANDSFWYEEPQCSKELPFLCEYGKPNDQLYSLSNFIMVDKTFYV